MDQKAHLTQEDFSIDSLPLHVDSLVHQLGKVSAHADVDGLFHFSWQRPLFLIVVRQGLLIELQTQGQSLVRGYRLLQRAH